MAVENTGCLGMIIGLLMGVFGLFMGVQSQAVPPPDVAVVPPAQVIIPTAIPPGQIGVFEVPTTIETVELVSSDPLTIRVTGYQADGCELPVEVLQTRAENRVQVRVYRLVPGDLICSMQLVPYDAEIELIGNYASGTYVIEVNGTELDVTL
jgi:hypothetical protein